MRALHLHLTINPPNSYKTRIPPRGNEFNGSGERGWIKTKTATNGVTRSSGKARSRGPRADDPAQPQCGKLAEPSGPSRTAVTGQGHPRSIFRRAIEHGNLILAEGMARELGQVTLGEALELVALVAQKDSRRHSRYAVRWLRRLLEEDERLTIEQGGPFGVLCAHARRPISRAGLLDAFRPGRSGV
jgi:hypothetical protein